MLKLKSRCRYFNLIVDPTNKQHKAWLAHVVCFSFSFSFLHCKVVLGDCEFSSKAMESSISLAFVPPSFPLQPISNFYFTVKHIKYQLKIIIIITLHLSHTVATQKLYRYRVTVMTIPKLELKRQQEIFFVLSSPRSSNLKTSKKVLPENCKPFLTGCPLETRYINIIFIKF